MRNVLILGASRGLGLEFVRQHRAAGDRVVATARTTEALGALEALGAEARTLDVADGDSVAAFSLAEEAFDRVILNAGVFGPRTQQLDAPSADVFDQVMHTNVLGAMRLLPRLLSHLTPGARLAVVSSRLGSIGERAGSHGWLYRASKAALNSVLRDASLAAEGRAICVSVHPGWVRTDMGGAAADLAPATSVAALRALLDGLTPDDNGRFFNYNGEMIAW